MPTCILYGNINDPWFIQEYSHLIPLLNVKDKQRFLNMKSILKRQQLVLSRFLLQQAVKQLQEKDPSNSQYSHSYNYHIENYSQLTINQCDIFSISISHSGSIAAVCVSTNQLRIGIDVEKLKQRDFETLYKEICTKEELTLAKELQYQPLSFYKLWTAKEALTKAINCDLRESFSVNCTNVLNDMIGVITLGDRLFYYNIVQLTQSIESYVGTVVLESCNSNHSNNDVLMSKSSRETTIDWQYYYS